MTEAYEWDGDCADCHNTIAWEGDECDKPTSEEEATGIRCTDCLVLHAEALEKALTFEEDKSAHLHDALAKIAAHPGESYASLLELKDMARAAIATKHRPPSGLVAEAASTKRFWNTVEATQVFLQGLIEAPVGEGLGKIDRFFAKRQADRLLHFLHSRVGGRLP